MHRMNMDAAVAGPLSRLSAALLFTVLNLLVKLMGPALALLGGCSVGLTVTLIRALRQSNGPVVIYLHFCTIGTLVTLPKFILNPILPATPAEWTMIADIVLVSVTAQLLMNQGFFFCKGCSPLPTKLPSKMMSPAVPCYLFRPISKSLPGKAGTPLFRE
jgi:hypothetical protein